MAAVSDKKGLLIDAELVALLREIRDELRGLRRDQRQAARLPSLSRADRAQLTRLLPAIVGHLGSEWFVVREAIATLAVRLVVEEAGLNARQVGRLLRRAEGCALDGLVVERGGTELHRTLWRVMATVDEFSTR